MKTDTFPDFLGIGAARAGTTWLYANLRRHPQIWVAPVKELHYFDRSTEYASPSFLATDSLLGRLFGRGQHNASWRRRLRGRIGRAFIELNAQRIAWDCRFFFGTYNDAWYASLFRAGQGKVKGEITPSYAILDRPDVARVARLMPDVKLVYIVRNPIEQVWSWLGHEARLKGNLLSSCSVDDLVRAANSSGVCLRADFLRTITTWLEFFCRQQLFIGFYDNIEADPEAFLAAVMSFLGVEARTEHLTPAVHERFNAGAGKPIPRAFEIHLARKMLPQLQAMADALGGHATRWLADAEQRIEENRAMR